MRTMRTGVAIALVLAGALRCGDKGTEPNPDPTAMVVSLATPNADDGAVMVTVRGPDLSTIQSSSTAYVVYSRSAAAQEARVIVVGDVVNGPLFRVTLGTGHAISAYSATIEQVATRADALRAGLSGYRLTVSAAAQ